MDVIEVSKDIKALIDAIKDEGKLSKGLIFLKAGAMRKYDEQLAITVASLRAAETPVSIIDKLAKGKVGKELCAKIIAEETLKAHFSRLDYLKAQLNGYQSIYRHLDET